MSESISRRGFLKRIRDVAISLGVIVATDKLPPIPELESGEVESVIIGDLLVSYESDLSSGAVPVPGYLLMVMGDKERYLPIHE